MRNFKDFSKQIKKIRTIYQLSMSEMGNLLLVSSAYIAMWENGERNPSHEILIKITEIFGVSSDWLIGFPESVYNKKIIADREELFVDAALQKYDTGSKYCALMDLSLMIKNHYSTVKQREKYSLPVRANLCYLFYLYSFYAEHLGTLRLNFEQNNNIDNKIQNLKKIKKYEVNKKNVLSNISSLLLSNSRPLFDLTKDD